MARLSITLYRRPFLTALICGLLLATGLSIGPHWSWGQNIGPLLFGALLSASLLSVIRLQPPRAPPRVTAKQEKPEAPHAQLTVSHMTHLLEVHSDVLWLMDLKGNRFYTSAAVTRIRGYTPQEIEGLSLEQNFVGESILIAGNILRQARENPAEIMPLYELEMTHKNGSTVWCEVSVSVLRAPDGRADCLLGVSRDISARKQTEALLQQREALLSSIFRNSPCSISVTSASDGRLLDANQAWLSMFGFTREQAVGRTSKQLNCWEKSEDRKAILQTIRTKGYIRNAEVRFRHQSGGIFDALTSAEAVEVGGVRYFVGVSNNISERKRLDAQRLLIQRERAALAESRERAKTRFLAAASHDLRQPVQAARLFLDLLRNKDLTEDQQQLCQQISTAMESLSSLLDCLLDITRIESGGVSASFQDVEVSDILSRLDDEFAALAQAQGLRFKLFFPMGARVRTDPQLVNLILRNLVSNALKYTRQGGLLIGARCRHDRLVLQVWDTGVGIGPEHEAHIFEEFYQAGNPHRDNGQGLGLGLPICQRLTSLIHAKLSYRSCPGRGSMFELTLPRRP